MKRRPTSRLSVLGMAFWFAASGPAIASAETPIGELPPDEDDPLASARRDAAGAHFAIEGGPAVVYAPALPSATGPSLTGTSDVVVVEPTDAIVVAGAELRLGAQIGVSRLLDVRFGVGAWLGRQAVGEAVGPFAALPHAYVGLTIRPHDLYFAELGIAGGALVFEEAPGLRFPLNPVGALFGEIAPLGLAFGGHHALRLKLTQGLGTMITGEYDACASIPPGFVCASNPAAEGPARVYFAGQTMITFGGVVP